MTLGERIRELRTIRSLTQREAAAKAGIDFTYLSKIENGKLDRSDHPSEKLIRKLADVLGGNTDELLLLAEKVPDSIRRRALERPDVFLAIANCDDDILDKLMEEIGKAATLQKKRAK